MMIIDHMYIYVYTHTFLHTHTCFDLIERASTSLPRPYGGLRPWGGGNSQIGESADFGLLSQILPPSFGILFREKSRNASTNSRTCIYFIGMLNAEVLMQDFDLTNQSCKIFGITEDTEPQQDEQKYPSRRIFWLAQSCRGCFFGVIPWGPSNFSLGYFGGRFLD